MIEELDNEISELYTRMGCQDVHRALVDRGHYVTQRDVTKRIKDLGLMRRSGFPIGGRPRQFYTQRACEICCLLYTPRSGTQKFCRRCVPNGDRRAQGVASLYGINKLQFDEMLSMQHDACAICHEPFVDMNSKHIHVDHDHKTNVVRGVLCHRCNHALGLMKDNPTALRQAATYLETHEEKQKQLSRVADRQSRRQA